MNTKQQVASYVLIAVAFLLGLYCKSPRVVTENIYITEEQKNCESKGGIMHYYNDVYNEGLQVVNWKCVIPSKVIDQAN